MLQVQDINASQCTVTESEQTCACTIYPSMWRTALNVSTSYFICSRNQRNKPNSFVMAHRIAICSVCPVNNQFQWILTQSDSRHQTHATTFYRHWADRSMCFLLMLTTKPDITTTYFLATGVTGQRNILQYML